MDLDQLSYLVAVETYGSISAAAEHAHMTQPSLSRSLKRLEQELGHELFDHGSNKVQFNEAGRIALAYAKEIIGVRERMDGALAELEKKAHTIKVGSIASAPLWNLAARIIERFPGTILGSDMVAEERIEAQLLDRAIDLAIARKPSPLPCVRSTPLMSEHLFLSAPQKSAYADKEWVSWNDLDGETFLIYEQIGFWRSVVDEAIPHAELVLQKDREVFLQIAPSTELLYFTTDAPQNHGLSHGRASIPIRDASAHVTFYLLARDDAPKNIDAIFSWIGESNASL